MDRNGTEQTAHYPEAKRTGGTAKPLEECQTISQSNDHKGIRVGSLMPQKGEQPSTSSQRDSKLYSQIEAYTSTENKCYTMNKAHTPKLIL